MKKSVYFLMMFIGIALTGCEPMEDIHEEVEARIDARPNSGNISYRLTEDDYDALGQNFPNFSSIEDANEALPDYLSRIFPTLGAGSIANVTVDIYVPNRATEVENEYEYEVTAEEYAELGFNYGNFDSADDIQKFLDYKYPDASNGDAVELTYKYYAGSVSTRTNTFVKVNDEWTQAVTLEREDYTAMGERFPNFSSRTDAQTDIATFLRLNNPYASEGDELAVIYDLYSSSNRTTTTYVEVFTYDGNSWTAPVPNDVVEAVLQFGHNGSEWEPDNTILYSLQPADYALIGQELAETYPDPAWSVGNYNNFDRRLGNRNYWSDEMLLEAINIVLDNRDPNAEEGQKYVITFAIYDGSAGTESISVIKQDGEWVRNEQ